MSFAGACGGGDQASGTGLCSPSYAPRELVERGPLANPKGGPGPETRTSDVAAIKKIAAAACSLPTPPDDIACTLELGPSFELRFVDTRGQATTLTAAAYGCQFVEGLDTRRFDAGPLWQALADAGLPAPNRR
ncbi:MAG TPA: hypothetical protein VGL47_01490 [Amycolatopsis sp.]|uniref:hypothetical protein n=1 Tax=Amycolatopsis sp. TaxID=37632 RepID=UPI002F3F7CF1